MRKIGILLSLFLAASVALACLNVTSASAQAADPPKGIHLTWQRNDTAHTIVVTWKTTTAEAGDKVLYDTKSGGGDPARYRYSATGSSHTYVDANGYIHDVELTGLSPDTTYYFICGGETGGWSAERSFRTAPSTSKSFTFVAGGDSRPAGTYDYTNPAIIDIPPHPDVRNKISQLMAKFNPSFVLFVGDLVRDAFDQSQWDNWFEMVETYWVDNDGRSIPIIPAIGNHEVYYPPSIEYSKENAKNYYGSFALPENERWYSLDWGPDLHITVLNSEIHPASKEQFEWLWNDLTANRDKKWKIVIFHRPPFAGGHSDERIRDYWIRTGAFDTFHVDLAIYGHVHNYERTKPINFVKSEKEPQASPEDGTIYIASGGWGAPMSSGKTEWFSAYGPAYKYHFTVIDIFENGTLRLRAVDNNGIVFDEFSITKPAEAPGPGISLLTISVVAIVVLVVAAIAIYAFRRGK